MRPCLVVPSLLVAFACKREAPPPAPSPSPDPPPVEVSAADRARGQAVAGELKKSLVGALTAAMGQGVVEAIEVCHTEAPALTAALARDGIRVGRTTRKPRNPGNAATGWHGDALGHFEALAASGPAALEGASFARRLPGGGIAYAEPLVIGGLCLACHGATLAPEVETVLATRYPDDRATGYAVGELRGIVWVELPAASK
jgi:hypothetical protein